MSGCFQTLRNSAGSSYPLSFLEIGWFIRKINQNVPGDKSLRDSVCPIENKAWYLHNWFNLQIEDENVGRMWTDTIATRYGFSSGSSIIYFFWEEKFGFGVPLLQNRPVRMCFYVQNEMVRMHSRPQRWPAQKAISPLLKTSDMVIILFNLERWRSWEASLTVPLTFSQLAEGFISFR